MVYSIGSFAVILPSVMPLEPNSVLARKKAHYKFKPNPITAGIVTQSCLFKREQTNSLACSSPCICMQNEYIWLVAVAVSCNIFT